MSASEEIFSIRIVVADFYVQKPIQGLDPCYCQFLGKDIKKVSVIRIFGANSKGQKTCMHVHGVFPYFYIPYEKKDLGDVDKAIYQISTSIDKAINISLGQGRSQQTHVFKIQLVKGIPFYGFHGKEHQFLKIYMFNPRFVRRAANLFQNGAILGKVFQPYEAHVPYILQFLIDYNLYGMSLLHVPKDIVKFRTTEDDEEIEYDFSPAQRLQSSQVSKISTSQLEVDISAAFILNRFQILKSKAERTNPGMEAIWQDEKLRREKLSEANMEMPSLAVAPSQERIGIEPTESDLFYRTALQQKILNATAETTLDQSLMLTLNESTQNQLMDVKEKKRTFNLKSFLVNSVYPEECTQEEDLVNASLIQNHFSNESSLEASQKKFNPLNSSDDVFLNDTLVDEDLVLSLTQQSTDNQNRFNLSLHEQDFDLLEVMKQLEENNDNPETVDLDSSLAPLTQTVKSSQKVETYDQTEENEESDGSEHEDCNDFTMVLEDIDELLLKISQTNEFAGTKTETIPQLDGADDLCRTPTKRIANNTKKTPKTPKQPNTSKTPKTKSRYRPLEFLNKSQSAAKDLSKLSNSAVAFISDNESIISISSEEDIEKKPIKQPSLRKKIAQKKHNKMLKENKNCTITSSNIIAHDPSDPICSLDKTETHITCNLTPKRVAEKSNKRLKTYKTEIESSANIESKKCTPIDSGSVGTNNPTKNMINIEINEKKIQKQHHVKNLFSKEKVENLTQVGLEDNCASPSTKNYEKSKKFNLKRFFKTSTQPIEKKIKLRKCRVRLRRLKTTSETACNSNEEVNRKPSSPMDLAREFDRRNNFFPEAGPSHINYYQYNDFPYSNTPKKDVPKKAMKKRTSTLLAYSENEDNDEICAFDDQSFLINSPSLFNDGSPTLMSQDFSKIAETNSITFPTEAVIITPRELPPAIEEVESDCIKLKIPDYVFEKPFFSVSSDITSKKDVGNTVLSIRGKTLNDYEEFKCSVNNVVGINDQRKRFIKNFGIPFNFFKSNNGIKEFLATNSKISMSTRDLPPTKREAISWVRAREDLKSLENAESSIVQLDGDDSPIKIKRQKIAMIIVDDENNDSLDSSMLTVNASPITPAVDASKTKLEKEPAANKINVTPRSTPCSGKRLLRRSLRQRLQLKNKIKIPLKKEEADGKSDSVDNAIVGPISTNNESLHNQMQRKSFRRRLENSQLSEEDKNESTDVHKKRKDDQTKGEDDQTKGVENQKKGEEDQAKSIKIENMSLDTSKIKDSQESTKSSESVINEDDIKENNRTSFLKSFQADLDSSFGLSAASLNNTYGFKVNLENLNEAKADIEYTYLTTLSMEVFVETRDDLKPNPEFDKILCLFYSIVNSVPSASDSKPITSSGFIIVAEKNFTQRSGLKTDINITTVKTEIELLSELVSICRHWDPDIYAGYEIELSSWGYVMERAKFLDFNISPLLSRVPSQNIREVTDSDNEGFTDLDVETKLCGRILLDVWRLLRSEIALTSYTFENVMYHILHRRCALHGHKDLTMWFMSDQTRWIVLSYYMQRVDGTLDLLNQLDLIGRTSEMAKLIGIQFYEVLSRGSQFRVESMMLRIAKPRNLVPLSPSVQQRAHMRAPEYLPLILEPQSRFYVDPMIVLDFQSLYPSIIIGYNYCFSTCLGRVEHLGQTIPFEFGASQYRCSPHILKKLIENDLITVSPCGVVFVKSAVRGGILPRMLSEILDTRLMVKQSMKVHRNNSALQRILHSRQLGLKLMANVTYGYTAANFSGRMPCVEVGDSVVAKGRETLERAIKLVEANDKWNVKVVYGDTDSLFVLVPGRSREEAFRIGEEISEAVTKSNPQPIKLKLEKVYQPCILQTKKRYVGYMYESADQAEPTYEAKGIETVRRDGCPAVAKMLEKSLRILFETRDVSKVKSYVSRQFTKLLSGKANLQDLIFAKEFRGINGYKPTACVPALELTRKWIQSDPRNIPRRGERVPFIVTNGPPGYPLIRLIRSPHEVLADEGLKINAIYYITKAIIPPLNRCFLLIGADVNEWFADLPRKLIQTPALSIASEIVGNNANKKSTISQYFSSMNCITDCGRQTQNGICEVCSHSSSSVVELNYKINKFERAYHQTKLICQICCERYKNVTCQSLDCPVLYVLTMKKRQLNQNQYLRRIINQNFP